MSELLTSSRLSCRNCNLIFTTECHASGCSHNGIWHDKYSDCNIKCAMKLGWGQLGRSHYSCCYAVDKGAVCEATAHCFDIMEEGAKSSSPDHGPITASDCPRYVVNLDAPPGERWSHIVVDYLDKLPGVLQALDEILGTGLVNSFMNIPHASYIQFNPMYPSGVLAGIASSVMTGLTKVGRFYYGEEIEGISRITGIPVGKLALLQIAYEVFAACTSIVVNISRNGRSQGIPFSHPYYGLGHVYSSAFDYRGGFCQGRRHPFQSDHLGWICWYSGEWYSLELRIITKKDWCSFT